MSASHTMHVVRHSKYYLKDGDIVLCSSPDASHESTVFRVHKGVLSFNSPVFRDMFAVSNQNTVQDRYDDTAMIELSDSAEDLEGLLHALYDPGYDYMLLTPLEDRDG